MIRKIIDQIQIDSFDSGYSKITNSACTSLPLDPTAIDSPIATSFTQCLYNVCVSSASLGRPRSALVRTNSFDGLTLVNPQCPACGVGNLGVSVIVRLALVRGSPE